MKPNFGDLVLSKMMDRIEKASDRLAIQYKNIKPFDSTKVSSQSMFDTYSGLGIEDMNKLIQKYGEDVVSEYIYDMEKIRQGVKP